MKKKSSRKAEHSAGEGVRFTIGDTVGDGKGRPLADSPRRTKHGEKEWDADTPKVEREAQHKRNAFGYFKGKNAVKGYENEKLVSPEAKDSLRIG